MANQQKSPCTCTTIARFPTPRRSAATEATRCSLCDRETQNYAEENSFFNRYMGDSFPSVAPLMTLGARSSPLSRDGGVLLFFSTGRENLDSTRVVPSPSPELKFIHRKNNPSEREEIPASARGVASLTPALTIVTTDNGVSEGGVQQSDQGLHINGGMHMVAAVRTTCFVVIWARQSGVRQSESCACEQRWQARRLQQRVRCKNLSTGRGWFMRVKRTTNR